MLIGNLLSVGEETSFFASGLYMGITKVHMHVATLPPLTYGSILVIYLTGGAFAILSSTEILVIGGWTYAWFGESRQRVDSVYKGTLHLKL